jgi:hypothetical protein
MKYGILAAAFAVMASFGLPAQAAPLSSSALNLEVTKTDAVQKVWWEGYRRWRGRRHARRDDHDRRDHDRR